jgi:hypothetical protein
VYFSGGIIFLGLCQGGPKTIKVGSSCSYRSFGSGAMCKAGYEIAIEHINAKGVSLLKFNKKFFKTYSLWMMNRI